MKIDCYIIKDLMPSYVENLCSVKTACAVREHIEKCADCRKAEQLMRQGLPMPEIAADSGETAGAKRVVSRFKWQVARKIGVIFCAALICFCTIFLSVNQLRGNGFSFSSIPVCFTVQKYEKAIYALDAEKIYSFQAENIKDTAYTKEQISSAISTLSENKVTIESISLLKNEQQNGENIGVIEIKCGGVQTEPSTVILRFTTENKKMSFNQISEFVISTADAPKIGDKINTQEWLNDLYCVLGCSVKKQ